MNDNESKYKTSFWSFVGLFATFLYLILNKYL